MNTYSLFDLGTGIFSGRSITLPESLLEQNTPDGMGARLGVFDAKAKRVDVRTGEVVDWVPPADTLRDEAHARMLVMQSVRSLEAQQARSIRALLLDPNDQQARQRLADLEAQIVATGVRNKGG